MTTDAENSRPGTRRRYPRALGRWTGLGRGLGGEPAPRQRERAPRPVRERRVRAHFRPRTHARDLDGFRAPGDTAIRAPENDASRGRLADRGWAGRRDRRRPM